MKRIDPFEGEGQWYKGNLHCHTTMSDGDLTPEETVTLYRNNGWNFLALTDHRRYTHWKEFDSEDFIIIPGVEMDITDDRDRDYHIVGIGAEDARHGKGEGWNHDTRVKVDRWESPESVQKVIDEIRATGNQAIFCHPIWSRNELDDFKDLEGYFAMEVFNYGCHIESNTGLCTVYWDSLLRQGKKIWGVATDDAHHHLKDECGGWVVVKARELSRKAIMESLLEGRFYSSSGPTIHDFHVEDGQVFIECSGAKAIHFITYENVGYSMWAEDGAPLTSGSYRLRGGENYVRVECWDFDGNMAWTNPIFLK